LGTTRHLLPGCRLITTATILAVFCPPSGFLSPFDGVNKGNIQTNRRSSSSTLFDLNYYKQKPAAFCSYRLLIAPFNQNVLLRQLRERLPRPCKPNQRPLRELRCPQSVSPVLALFERSVVVLSQLSIVVLLCAYLVFCIALRTAPAEPGRTGLR
jgi:hypothetical protein